MKMIHAANASTSAETTDHRKDIPAVFHPFLSFIREAVPDANEMNTTGIVMNIPKLTRKDETEEMIS